MGARSAEPAIVRPYRWLLLSGTRLHQGNGVLSWLIEMRCGLSFLNSGRGDWQRSAGKACIIWFTMARS
jgi:hypothetical protein